MTTETQATREIIIASGSPFSSHSLSQRMIRKILDGERWVLGKPNSKAERAERRRQRIREQLTTQGQSNMIPELVQDEAYFSEKTPYAGIGDYERPIGSNGCEATIVDFTRIEIE